ncbi:MAG: hypothetical protein ACYC2T_08505 [Bacillota bacterium]
MSTTSISVMYGITAKVRPPRAVYLHFPLGSVTGAAFDASTQRQTVEAALAALLEMKTPGEIKKLSIIWQE